MLDIQAGGCIPNTGVDGQTKINEVAKLAATQAYICRDSKEVNREDVP